MNEYGVYINPYPNITGLSKSRIKSEARVKNFAWWVTGENETDALDVFISTSNDPELLYNFYKSGAILIEERN